MAMVGRAGGRRRGEREAAAVAKARAAVALRSAWSAARDEAGTDAASAGGVLAVLLARGYVASVVDVLEGCARLGLAVHGAGGRDGRSCRLVV